MQSHLQGFRNACRMSLTFGGEDGQKRSWRELGRELGI
jgi:hypothetical protein